MERLKNFRQLLEMAKEAKGKKNKIILHWSAGRYNQCFADYHINIAGNGAMYASTNDLAAYKEHCWKNNRLTIGISLSCGYGATIIDSDNINYGDYPPTFWQVENMAKSIAIISMGLNIAIESDNILTHAEQATIDGYGIDDDDPEMRWDLLRMIDYCNGKTLVDGGDMLRGKAIFYQLKFLDELAKNYDTYLWQI